MRLFLICVTSVALVLNARAQGTLFFYNHVPQVGLDAPVFDVGGLTLAGGYPLQAQLYAGPDASSLAPVGPPAFLAAGAQAGYWSGDGYISLTRTVPSITPGQTAFVQVRVWWALPGLSYEDVVARDGKHGESDVFPVVTGGDTANNTQPPTLPAYLTGLESFTLTGKALPIPEPCSLALLLTAGLLAAICGLRTATSRAG